MGDLSEMVSKGTTPREFATQDSSVINFIKAQSIDDSGRFVQEKIVFIDEQTNLKLKRSILQKCDILLTIAGTIGRVAIVTSNELPANCNQAVAFIRLFDKSQKHFVYYALKSRQVQNVMMQSVVEAVQPNLSLTEIKSLEIPYPPREEQEAIAEVLSSLDDKIDLLKRQNKTLEGMAEALFRQWFIEEAYDDWPEVELRDIAEVVDCLHSKKPEEVSEPFGLLLQVFNISNDGSINLNKKYGVNETDFKFWTKRIKIQYGDIIISKTGRVGARGWVHSHQKFGIGRNLVALRALDSQNMMFLRGLMMSAFMDRAITESTSDGTILQSLHVKSIERISFRLPTQAILNRIDVELRPIIERVTTNLNEITTLEAQRDTLLPKLMSGEVRVQMD